MARPVPNSISSGESQWDADVEGNFDLIFQTPVPLPEFASVAALPPANAYDRCFAIVNDTVPATGWQLVFSNGTTWIIVGRQGAAVANLSGTASAGYVQAELQGVMNKLDALLNSLRAAGAIAP